MPQTKVWLYMPSVSTTISQNLPDGEIAAYNLLAVIVQFCLLYERC
ncbi:MAG: hypothetical protein FWG88_11785 [Oscillospiraceae bacterium]|nr:hypothetical protein [Oscillospiraceae bacterium]